MKTNTKNEKQIKNGDKLKVILYVLLVVLISMISFGGIYVQKLNKMSNKLPEYILGTDLYGYRSVIIKPEESNQSNGLQVEVVNDNEENGQAEDTTEEDAALNIDNYQKVKTIIEDRLKYAGVNYYEIKCNETDGTIALKLQENSNTDSIAQYCITKGEFTMSDSETDEVFLNNSHIKNVSLNGTPTSNGTVIYLSIEFNKEGTEKLKEISNTYVKSTDEEGNDTSKKIKMSIDGSEMLSSSFEEEISDGRIQLTLGTSTDSNTLRNYISQGNNIAVLLNSGSMPITYKMDVNRFVHSSITTNTILKIAIVASIIYAIILIYMVIKYKKSGVLSAIACIGFMALLLISVRVFNVDITLTGLSTIILSAFIEYLMFITILKLLNTELDKETKKKELKKKLINQMQYAIPLVVIAVVFALSKWEPMYSIGMNLFWAIIVALIWNFIVLKFIILKKE